MLKSELLVLNLARKLKGLCDDTLSEISRETVKCCTRRLVYSDSEWAITQQWVTSCGKKYYPIYDDNGRLDKEVCFCPFCGYVIKEGN